MVAAAAAAVVALAGVVVLVAMALAPRLGRTVPGDVVAPEHTGFGGAEQLRTRPAVHRSVPAEDHDLAA